MYKRQSYYNKNKKQKKLKLLVTFIVLGVITGAIVYYYKSAVVNIIPTINMGEYTQNVANYADTKGKTLSNQIKTIIDNFSDQEDSTGNEKPPERQDVLLRIGVMSDSHGSSNNIEKAIRGMQAENVNMIIHLGDFSAGGEVNHFQEAKKLLERSGVEWYVLPGDHDFNWFPEHSRSNYEDAFGESYDQNIIKDDIQILMHDNSVDTVEASFRETWLINNINPAKKVLLFSTRPLYSPYFETKDDPHGDKLIKILADLGVQHTFGGNTHVYAEYFDMNDQLKIITVGAIGEYKNPLPQWVLLQVYGDESVEYKPVPIIDF